MDAAFWSAVASFLSAALACIAVLVSFRTFAGLPAVVFQKVDIRRVTDEKIDLAFCFKIENVGREPLSLIETIGGYYNFATTSFHEQQRLHGMNLLYPGNPITVRWVLEVDFGKPVQDHDLQETLREEMMMGDLCVMAAVRFRGQFPFSVFKKRVVSYAQFRGSTDVMVLDGRRYQEMADCLPKEFQS